MAVGGTATRFVGREQELEAVLDAARRAAAGHSGTLLVSGASGLGASRLIEEAIARLQDGSAPLPGRLTVLRGDGLPAWRGAPYAPFRIALERRVAGLQGDDLATVLGSGSDLLLPLVPRIAARLGTAANPASRERLSERIQEAFRSLLGRMAMDGPVVLVIEDLHVLDAASRGLLAFLARTLGQRPILIVGSYQPDALGRGHPLRATFAAIDGGPRPAGRIELAPLDRAALRDFISAREDEAPSAPVLLLVAERSGGSPLVADQVLAARRELSGASLVVPLDQLTVARAARHSPECRRALRILAVAQGPLMPSRLGAVAAAYDADMGRPAPRSAGARRRDAGGIDGDLAAGVAEAIAAGFVEVLEDVGAPAHPRTPRRGMTTQPVAGPVRVRHELLAAALAGDLLPTSRRRMHAAVAVALGRHPAEAGRHWHAAHESRRELGAEIAAATAAETIGAAADALVHLEWAIELAGAPAVTGQLAESDEVDLLLRAAEACAGSGDTRRAVAFVESAIARRVDRHDRAAMAILTERLATFRWEGGDRDGALAAYERALELLPGTPTVDRARLLAVAAKARMLEGSFSEAERLAEEAVVVAGAAGEEARAWRGHATCTLGTIDGWLGRPARAVTRLEEALATATDLRRLDDAFRARANLTTVLDLQGRREDAARVARDGIVAAEADGLEIVHGNLLRGNAADFLVSLGRWREARELAELALDWAPSGVPFVNAALGLAVVETETHAGDTAARLLGRLFLELETIPDVQFAVPAYQAAASFAMWRGDIVEATRAIDAGWERVQPSEEWALAARMAAAAMAVAAERARRAHERRDLHGLVAARAWGEAILREAERMVEASGVPDDAWVRREVDADLATARAFGARVRASDTARMWADVAARWRALGRPYEAARALYAEVEAHLEAGTLAGARREGREDARLPLGESAQIAAELGALPLLRALADLAARSRIQLPQAAVAALDAAGRESHLATPPDEVPRPDRARRPVDDRRAEQRTAASFGLSPREQGVLAEVVAGRTNREIGERLFISEKTVGVHVGNILAKLGVGGRVEAATVALRLGLVDELVENAKRPGPRGPGLSSRQRGGAA